MKSPARGSRFLAEAAAQRTIRPRVAAFVDPWGGKWDLLEPTGVDGDASKECFYGGAWKRQILFWGASRWRSYATGCTCLGPAITPFAAGIVLGYLLDPVVSKMERLGLNRLGATLLILVAFASAFVIALIIVAPVLSNQLVAFAEHLPGSRTRLQALGSSGRQRTDRKVWRRLMPTALGFGAPMSTSDIQKSVGDFVAQGAQWLLNAFLKPSFRAGRRVFGFLSLLVITPVVAFYILIDWQQNDRRMTMAGCSSTHRDRLRAIAKEINHALAGFIRGQSLVCLFLGLWYGLGSDARSGSILASLSRTLAGVLSWQIPYVGSLTALLRFARRGPGPGVAPESPKLFLMALGIVGFGQFLEGNVISPKLVGGINGLHPVWPHVRAPLLSALARNGSASSASWWRSRRRPLWGSSSVTLSLLGLTGARSIEAMGPQSRL